MTAKTILLFVLLGCWTGLSLAGDPDSVLVADTVWVGSASGEPGTHIMIPVTGKNTFPYGGMTVPLEYRLPNENSPVVCDSVNFNGCRTDYFEMKIANLRRDTSNHELVIGLMASMGGGAPPLTPGTGLWAKIYFTINPGAQPCTVSIDSTFFPPINYLLVTDSAGMSEDTPQFVPGRIIVLLGSGIETGKRESTGQVGGYKVRPNPFTSFTMILGHEGDAIALYDVSGRLVRTDKGKRIGEGLPPGVYYVMPTGSDAKPLRIVKVR